MKKDKFIILVILIIAIGTIALLTTGMLRKNTGQVQKKLTGFTATANINYKGTSFQTKVEYTSQDLVKMEIITPENLKGVTMAWNGKDINIEYMGLSVNVGDSAVLGKAIMSSIVSAINEGTKAKGETKGDAIIVKGKVSSGEYTLTVDKSTGIPISLVIPSAGLSCDFV